MSGKNVAIIGVASLFLVAMVIGVTIAIHKTDNGSKPEISATRKSIESICQPTDYKDTCVSTIEKGKPGSSSPKDLVKAAFEVALQTLNNITDHSRLLKDLEKDPKTANAVKVCKRLFGDAANDFRRSMDEIGSFDVGNIDNILGNSRIWLSATITYQATCLDGFSGNTTDAGQKVRKMLKAISEMSRNALAIVTGLESALGDLQSSKGQSNKRRLLSSMSSKNRRLMTWSDEYVAGHYKFVDDDFLEEMSIMNHQKRRLLNSRGDYNVGGDHFDDVVPRWLDLDDTRRKLLQSKKMIDLKPTVIVAQDGSGNYTKIGDAFAKVPLKNKAPFVILVKEGVYNEVLLLDKKKDNVVLIGEGPTKTKITGSNYFIQNVKTTIDTSTLTVKADKFFARDIGIENTAGPEKHQAVALVAQGDKLVFYNVHIDGYQDTLYAHTYRQYYRDCRVSGTIDFVFGDAAAFFQNCSFVVRKPLDNQDCIMTAQGRDDRTAPTGLIFHKSNITADPDYYPIRFKNKAYLGRPWRTYSKTIFMECHIDDLINPDGWLPWSGDHGTDTCYYGEYRNEGPGANTEHRVKWRGIKTILPTRAEKFMPRTMYCAGDSFVTESGVPYDPTLTSDSSKFVAPPGAVDEEPDDPRNNANADDKNIYKHSKSKKALSQLQEFPGESSFGLSRTNLETTSVVANIKRALLQIRNVPPGDGKSASNGVVDLTKMLMQDDETPPTSTPLEADNSSSEGGLTSQEPSPTNAPSDQSPSSELDRALIEDDTSSDTDTTPSESPSLKEELDKTVLDEQARNPATNDEGGFSPSVSNLESELMREESPTSAPSSESSPSSKVVKHDQRTLIEDDPSSDITPSQSPSSMAELDKTVLEEQARNPATNDEGGYSPSVSNLESELMREESPTSAPSSEMSSSSKVVKHDQRTLIEDDPSSDTTPTLSPSSMAELDKTVLEEQARNPATNDEGTSPSVSNLESTLMQEESSTSAPSSMTSPSTAKLDRTLMDDDNYSPTTAPVSSPSNSIPVKLDRTMIEDAPSESPSTLHKSLGRMLMQYKPPPSKAPNGDNDDNDDDIGKDEDVEDSHDKLVTPTTAKADSILESLHLKSRSYLSIDEMFSVSEKDSQNPNKDQMAQMAQLASSPNSASLLASALQKQNGTSIQGAQALAHSPNAGEVLQQLGMHAQPPGVGGETGENVPAEKSRSNRGYESWFGVRVVAVLVVLLVGV